MTPEERQFILDNCMNMLGTDICRHLGWKWPCRVYRFYKREGIKVPQELINKWKGEKNKIKISDEEKKLITKYTKEGVSQKRISRLMKRSPLTVQKWQRELGLRKYVERNIEKARIKKGSIPWNKGIPRDEWGLPEETIKVMSKTQFLPGNEPKNTKRKGEVSVRSGRNGTYKYIKISNRNWEFYHRYLWEKEHGPIPDDMIIRFKDGDSLNCDLDNLELIDRHTHIIRNSVHNFPEEVVDTIVLQGKLKKRINEIKDGSKK